jgi:hypothetical protein
MPLESDLKLDISKFDPARTSPEIAKFNEQLIKIMESGPKWYEVLWPASNHARFCTKAS